EFTFVGPTAEPIFRHKMAIASPTSLRLFAGTTSIERKAMTITVDARLRPALQARYFHMLMAACCVAIAFLGFAPTYWLPLAAGTFKANPVVHIHGLVFFSWTLFFLFQAWLVAAGRTARHRSIGLIGISLATLMTDIGIITAINHTKGAIAIGQAEASKAFTIVPTAGIAFIAVIQAIAN